MQVQVDLSSADQELAYTFHNGHTMRKSRKQLLGGSEELLLRIHHLLERKTPDEKSIARDIKKELERRRTLGNPKVYKAIQLAHPRGMRYMDIHGEVREMVFERDLPNMGHNTLLLIKEQIRGQTEMDLEAIELIDGRKEQLMDEQIARYRARQEEMAKNNPSSQTQDEYTEQQMKMMADQLEFDEEWARKYK